MATGPQPSLSPDQLVAVAINAIAANASWSGLLHDAARLAATLDNVGRPDLSVELQRGCLTLGRTLDQITNLSTQYGAELEALAALMDSREAGDDGGTDLG